MTQINNAQGLADHLELGMIGANGPGSTMSKAPDRWHPTWENNRELALAAEAAGLDFHLPFARWKGYGGESDPLGYTYDPIAWASALLAITKRITLFTTLHTTFTHPIVAAKHLATMTRIGPGRVGLNIVSGWNQEEADMFGVEQREHDERYEYTKEWLDVVLRLWSSDAPFHHEGRFFHLRGAIGKPRPQGAITLMSAGASPAGRRFAISRCDLQLSILASLDTFRDEVIAVKEAARREGREANVYGGAYIICRPTRREAEAYHDYISREMADERAIDNAIQQLGLGSRSFSPEFRAMFRGRFAAGHGHYPIVGDPDDVAEEIRRVRDTGARGLVLTFMDFARDLAYFSEEVLPRLVEMGVRRPHEEVDELRRVAHG